MATTKHMEIQTAGLVVVSQKLMRVAAAANSAERHSVSSGRPFHILLYEPGRVSYVARVSKGARFEAELVSPSIDTNNSSQLQKQRQDQ